MKLKGGVKLEQRKKFMEILFFFFTVKKSGFGGLKKREKLAHGKGEGRNFMELNEAIVLGEAFRRDGFLRAEAYPCWPLSFLLRTLIFGSC